MEYITKINVDGAEYDVGADTGSLVTEALEAAYPVGAIYISMASTEPSEIFGGTWESIEDAFLLAAGDTYAAGDTGGEATVTLTTSQMPSHTHTLTASGSVSSTFTGTAASHTHTYTHKTRVDSYASNGTTGHRETDTDTVSTGSTSITPSGTVSSTFTGSSVTTSSTGSGSAHNNMPPYLAVNAWKRTA